jgi:hypothetical protein
MKHSMRQLLMTLSGIRYGCHAETFVFRTFPTGHAETRIPFGGGFSEAIFAFAIEIMLSSASSTTTPHQSSGFLEAATRLSSPFFASSLFQLIQQERLWSMSAW